MAKSRNSGRDIKFANSKKSMRFERARLGDKTVEAVGGINGALGKRLKRAGVDSAQKLSGKMCRTTKRKYLRYMMKKSGSNVRNAMDSYVSLSRHCKKVRDCKSGQRR